MTPNAADRLRVEEHEQLLRCSAAMRGDVNTAINEREANVFRLAAMVVESNYPDEANRLHKASAAFFLRNGLKPISPVDVIKNGWVIDYPRLRNMLIEFYYEMGF